LHKSQLKNLYKLLDPEIREKNIRALRQWLRGQYWNISGQTMPAPIFLVGCSRSGTTVTYETLAASEQLISIGYELPQFWDGLWGPAHNNWESEAAEANVATPAHRQAFFRWFYSRVGKGRILDKTCINILRIPYLYQLFPDAHFIYLHRDGCSNVSSLIDGWNKDSHFGLRQFLGEYPCKIAIDDGKFDDWRFFLPPGWRDYNHAKLEEVCAFQWLSANQMALQAKSLIPARQWTQIRYEDLLDKPLETFEYVFKQLNLPFDSKQQQICRSLASRPTSLVSGAPDREKWKKRNLKAIENIQGRLEPMLKELGYDIG